MQLNKKVLTLTITALALLGLGFGCKTPATVKGVTLNFWTVYDNVGELQKLAKEYKVLRPYVNVNIKQVRYEEFDKLLLNALADDVSPDIVSLQNRWLGRYLNRLAPMPASVKTATIEVQGKYIQETVITKQDTIMPTLNYVKGAYVGAVYDDAVVGGNVYGLPMSLDTLAIYYNKDLLDKAGMPEPPANWTDFMAAVKAGTKFDKDGNIIQSGVALGTANNIDNFFDIVSLFLTQSGVSIASGNYITFASGLENRVGDFPIFRALNFYTDFARNNKEAYSWNEKMGNALQQFAQGKTLFYFGFAYDYPKIMAMGPGLNVETIPMLQLNTNSPSNVANYWLESVMKKSKHQDEAWDFIRFITLPENVKKYTTGAKLPSPLRSQILEQKKDVFLAPFASQILTAKNWYRGSNYDAAKQAIADMIHSYLQPYEGTDLMYFNKIVSYAQALIQQTM